jgi:hypothetical protein
MIQHQVALNRERAISFSPVFYGKVDRIAVYNKVNGELPTTINFIRLAFFNDERLKVLLDFYRSAPAIYGTNRSCLFPVKDNFIADYSYCRIENIYGDPLHQEEIFLCIKGSVTPGMNGTHRIPSFTPPLPA